MSAPVVRPGIAVLVAAALAILLWPDHAGLTLQLLVVFLVVLTIGMALASVVAESRVVRFVPTGSRKSVAAPGELVRLRRQVELGSASPNDYRRFLRGSLSEIAARLLRGHGIDLASEPVKAQRVLGLDAWELVRPDVPRSLDAPGMDRLTALVERLEQL